MRAGKVENVSALVAYAADPDGHRRLLAITLGPEESEDSWSELLEQLLERGLSGVELVIADKHAGLAAALRRFLPEVRRQRCTVHLQRNVLAKVPHRLRKRVARAVAAVFRAGCWHNELPEAMRVLERAPAHRDQASDPERRRLPRPSQRAPPHHCGCSKDYCGLERTSLPGSHASRTEGGRQGSLTEASRSFLSLLHTTRLDRTVHLQRTVLAQRTPRNDQASNPERQRLPRPSQCTPPHHRGCSEDYCGLERAPLPGPLTPRAQEGRQGSLTEASRSFLSLLHTTRDLTMTHYFILPEPGRAGDHE